MTQLLPWQPSVFISIGSQQVATGLSLSRDTDSALKLRFGILSEVQISPRGGRSARECGSSSFSLNSWNTWKTGKTRDGAQGYTTSQAGSETSCTSPWLSGPRCCVHTKPRWNLELCISSYCMLFHFLTFWATSEIQGSMTARCWPLDIYSVINWTSSSWCIPKKFYHHAKLS